MSLKTNINKIHADLLNKFTDVKISEKSNLTFGEYFEISAINEDKQIIMILKKRELESSKFNWSYYSNPNTKEFLVERISNLDCLVEDVEDIFNKNRFDSDYLNQTNK